MRDRASVPEWCSRRSSGRAGLALAATLALLNACASEGCEGCALEPIPGGFPAQHRMDNVGQVRLTDGGLTWLGQNFSRLVNSVAGTGSGDTLTFDIPPSCAGDQRLCCDGSPCSATLDFKSVVLAPQPQSRLHLRADAEVRSTKILFEVKVSILGWFKCEVQYDSTKGTTRTVGVDADIDLVVDANDGNKLKISRGATSIRDFDCADISIHPVTAGGYVYCYGADLLCPLFRDTIEAQVRKPIEETVDELLAALPTGSEGRIDTGSLMSYFAGARGKLDVFAWGGGFARTENQGMSVGVMVGARSPAVDPCVPDCEAPGAPCQPPARVAIDRASTFKHNTRPDGKAFHVGIGVHRQGLEHAAYGLYRGGGLCLEMDSSTVRALRSSLFALLIPSLGQLTNDQDVPMAVHLRPRHPPTIELGKGTTRTDDKGNTVIDDPLITINAREITAGIHVLIEDRWIRLMTIAGDLALPVLLFADADGNLQPILGDLESAIANVRVENSELLAEKPESLAKLFPSLISVAGQALASGFAPIELPEFQGVELFLDSGSITSVENNQMLAVFARLGLTQTLSASVPLPLPMPMVETEVSGEVEVPEQRAFAVGSRRADDRPPAVVLTLDARLPPELAAESPPLEWTFRVDGGFYRPWVSLPRGQRVVVSDPVLWLQGEHVIEVIARVEGQPRTTDRTPARFEFSIDTVPPRISLEPAVDGLRALVEDAVTPSEQIEVSWRVAGGSPSPFSALAAARTVRVAPGEVVEVRARDRAGNVAAATAVAGVQLRTGPVSGLPSGGCALSGRTHESSPLPLALLVVLGVFGLAGIRRCRALTRSGREDLPGGSISWRGRRRPRGRCAPAGRS